MLSSLRSALTFPTITAPTFLLPTYKYVAERSDPFIGRTWYINLTIDEFVVETGKGQFELVWIEDKTTILPNKETKEIREVVTFTGTVDAASDDVVLTPATAVSNLKVTVARLGPFASIARPGSSLTIEWPTTPKEGEGEDALKALPTWTLKTNMQAVESGQAPTVELHFSPVSLRDLNSGVIKGFFIGRAQENWSLKQEGSTAADKVDLEWEGRKNTGGEGQGAIESNVELSFIDVGADAQRANFHLEWVEDWTASLGKTTREVILITGDAQDTAEHGIYLRPVSVKSISKIALARLGFSASIGIPFSQTECIWHAPAGYNYDGGEEGAVPAFNIPGVTIAELLKQHQEQEQQPEKPPTLKEITLNYTRLCQVMDVEAGTTSIKAKEKQAWTLSPSSLHSLSNTFGQAVTEGRTALGKAVEEKVTAISQAVDEITTTATTTSTAENPDAEKPADAAQAAPAEGGEAPAEGGEVPADGQ